MSNPIKLYNFPKSGHAHRIELMLSLLNLPTELVFVDLAKGAHKQPDFLALNPFGQVPLVDDNGTVIADLAPSSSTWPKNMTTVPGCPKNLPPPPVQRWLSVAERPAGLWPGRRPPGHGVRGFIQCRRSDFPCPHLAQGDRCRVGEDAIPGG